jgi:hypothetical protein
MLDQIGLHVEGGVIGNDGDTLGHVWETPLAVSPLSRGGAGFLPLDCVLVAR